MSEMKERELYERAQELALQIEEKRIEFGGEYSVNEHNMDKFRKIYDFFRGLVDNEGGEVRCLDIHPESACASISIETSLIDLHKDAMKQFVDILQYMDVFEVKPTTSDSLLISAGVNHLWETVG